MRTLNRRKFIGIGGTTLAAGLISPKTFSNGINPEEKIGGITPMIHSTDLYHLHGDPDDHYDLASIYALAYQGNFDLQGILIDFPKTSKIDPDVMGVAQMNYLTGLAVPSIIGTPYTMNKRNDIQPQTSKKEHQGINWVIDNLKKSQSPVVINIVGSATNIAVASKKEPTLFKEKCKAIYISAGSAYPGENDWLESNVGQDPSAYAAIFDLLCPVYWLPCWHKAGTDRRKVLGEYGSYYRFLQNDILPDLPDKLQNFFLFMLGRKESHNWFNYLNGKPEQELLERFGKLYRDMWSTAGFFHAAGKKITREGEIVSENSDKVSIFSFIPVKVSCDDNGNTTWEANNLSKNRYIFHVNDLLNYQKAMTWALKNLLLQFPE
jgi:hypothetical protein